MFCSCRISTDNRVAQSLCHSRASCQYPTGVPQENTGSRHITIRVGLYMQVAKTPIYPVNRAHFHFFITMQRYMLAQYMLSLCVCLSVIRQHCIKTTKLIIQTPPHDSPYQIYRRNSNGVTGGGTNAGGPVKIGHFQQITHYNSKRFKIDS